MERRQVAASEVLVPAICLAISLFYFVALAKLNTAYNDHFATPATLALGALSLLQLLRAFLAARRELARSVREPIRILRQVVVAPETHFAVLIAAYVLALAFVPYVPATIAMLIVGTAILTIGRARRSVLVDWRWWLVSVALAAGSYYVFQELLRVPLVPFG